MGAASRFLPPVEASSQSELKIGSNTLEASSAPSSQRRDLFRRAMARSTPQTRFFEVASAVDVEGRLRLQQLKQD